VILVVLVAMHSIVVPIGHCATDTPKETRGPSELAWFNSNASALKELTSTPPECVLNAESDQVRLGRIAFNSPRLLGGQAARMGLSCASCHPAGRRSDGFFIPQISDRPGHADVTHSILSSKGGNRVFNPSRIPDLADPKNLKISDRNSQAFREQLIRLIEIEFDGQPAPTTLFEALRVYLRNTNIEHCADPHLRRPKKLLDDWQAVLHGLDLIENSIVNNQPQTLNFLVAATRSQLGIIYRRFGIKPVNDVDQNLIEYSRELAKLRDNESNSTESAKKKLKQLKLIRVNTKNLFQKLHTNERISAYNPSVLSEYLKINGVSNK